MNPKIEAIQPLMPLIQQVLRYLAIGLLLLIFSRPMITILRGVQDRVLTGSAFSIGPSGLKFGEAPQLAEALLAEADIDELLNGHAFANEPMIEQSAPTKGGGMQQSLEFYGDRPSQRIDHVYYLVHAAKKVRADQYDVMIRVGCHNAEAIDKVERVVYRLHKTFPDPVREIRNRDNAFELKVSAWGQFMLHADVYLEGRTAPIKIDRYLNF